MMKQQFIAGSCMLTNTRTYLEYTSFYIRTSHNKNILRWSVLNELKRQSIPVDALHRVVSYEIWCIAYTRADLEVCSSSSYITTAMECKLITEFLYMVN